LRRNVADLAFETRYSQRADTLHIGHAGYREETAASAVLLRTWFRGSVLLAAHRSPGNEEDQGRVATQSRPGESSQRGRDRPATLHRVARSSSWSSTSCSTALERARSRAPLSAASITWETTERTSWEISGFHLLSLISNSSAMASTTGSLRYRLCSSKPSRRHKPMC
jgi:hypothetical protein